MIRTTLASATVALAVLSGCASSPAPPFDTLKSAQTVWALRLQNYEPPPQAAGQPAAGVPPAIQQWLQMGAQALPQLIPPGLLPPGLLPNLGATAPAPAADNVKRFQGFRVLSDTQIVDPDLREQLADLLGDEDSFQAEHAGCQFAEMGLSWQGGPQPSELLISFSCNQVVARTFAWPHAYTGMKPKTVKELSEIVQKLWPPGA